MHTLSINGLDFAVWQMFERWHVECRGIIEDFDSSVGALAWCYQIAR